MNLDLLHGLLEACDGSGVHEQLDPGAGPVLRHPRTRGAGPRRRQGSVR